ncbi:MAG: cytochrome P450 [Okeania sp. SIO2F4]|uniref:cytochrome P450 n=1 Tax=Okeania sp. SIO2F4 TaxID=2607790 RepID=UPI00142A0C59|nr:cytochrome P450 [Okeania sp. SIO2F4]NES04524.1 cytochrome P450 [Okeania sp. SIO2F4]
MNMNPVSSLPLPPGNLGLPFIGKNKIFRKNYQYSMKEIHQKYGSLYKTRILGKKFIYFQGYEAVKFVLTNENKYFAPCYIFKNSQRIFGQTDITWLAGQEHRDRQKLLTKTLKNKVLDNYIHTIHNLSNSYFLKWIKSDFVDLYFEINNYTLDLVLKLLLGIDSASESEIDNYLKEMRSGLNTIPLAFPWTKLGRGLKSKDKLFNQFEQIIVKRQKESDFGSDVLGILLTVQEEIDSKLTVREIAEQMVNLLSLGRKELSSALSSFLILTSEHLDVLKSLQIEQEKLDSSEPLSLAKLKKMVYLEQVIKEVLRLAPPVSGGLREVIQDCSFQGFRIPKGWNVTYQVSSVLEDPEIYKEPEIFNPERFNAANAEDKKKPLCYIPFGGGARECIGKEFAYLVIKIFISTLLDNCSWKFKENQDLTINKFPVARPANKIEVCFTNG